MAKERRYSSGEIIIRENDFGETAFVIEQGRIKVTKKRGGRTVHIAELGPGGTIGEMSMIDEKPRSATVTAMENTILREVHRSEFFEALQKETDAAIRLLRVIFERLREADARITELASYLQPEDDSLMGTTESSDKGLYALLEPQKPPLDTKRLRYRAGQKGEDAYMSNRLGS